MDRTGAVNRALAAVQEADVLAQATQRLLLEAYAVHYHGQLLHQHSLMEDMRQQLEQARALVRTAGVQDLWLVDHVPPEYLQRL